MKTPPYVGNHDDNMHCLLACYRMIMQHFWRRTMSWEQIEAFSGFHDGKAPWAIRSLVQFNRMGLDIKMIEPFDYHRYLQDHDVYLMQFFSPDQYDWFKENSSLDETETYLEEFFNKIDFVCRPATLADIDTMLTDNRLVAVTLNSRALNGKNGFVSHVVLVYAKKDEGYLMHDPGLPHQPERIVSGQLLEQSMGSIASITGFRRDEKRGVRLDQWVTGVFPLLSRAYAAKLIAEKHVVVNGKTQVKPGYKLRSIDSVEIDYDPSELLAIPEINLDIIYEDEDCVVINKPAGVLTHSVGDYTAEGTVATWLRNRQKDMQGPRGGIVHRLDRATSGVMICAKTPEALSWLQKQFAQRLVKKTYVAVIQGTMNPEVAIIDMPIERNPKAPAKFRVGAQGKHAITSYRTMRTNGLYTMLELKPETGRTHQLRVHLLHQGHPIVGDVIYGGEKAERMYLHAEELELTILAGHERKLFKVSAPAEFNNKVAS